MNYKVYLTSSSKAKGLKRTKDPCIIAIEPEDFTKSQIIELKNKNYTVLGYMSIGSVSDERSYYKSLEPYILRDDKGNKIRLKDWEHEYFLDLRRTKARDWCVQRAREIIALGCDGVWLDNVDVYEECKKNAMLEAITSTIRRIKGIYNCYVMINGGMKYLQKAMDTEFDNGVYKVQCGAFRYYHNAEELQKTLEKSNIDTIIKTGDDGLYRVQTGAFSKFKNAYTQLVGVIAIGVNAYIHAEGINSSILPISNYIDGVTQEEVFTKIKKYSGRGEFGSQSTAQSGEYQEHLYRVKTHGMETFLLEYTRSSDKVKQIKDFCKKYNHTGYYCASDVNL